MTALSRSEILKKMIDWVEDEFYWFEIVEDSEKMVITIHKMRVKDPSKRKKVSLKQTELELGK